MADFFNVLILAFIVPFVSAGGNCNQKHNFPAEYCFYGWCIEDGPDDKRITDGTDTIRSAAKSNSAAHSTGNMAPGTTAVSNPGMQDPPPYEKGIAY
ncbi:hypothetical protein MAR_001462 [Mya arenaria]|uniref:Uncharacterized protein n=1 Tax=Mya arenaria TaxID=6604 RepID=A0ABY7FFJ1_MYAAR|nr:hypothetical protein MAR_001462 [Mya arenaria]